MGPDSADAIHCAGSDAEWNARSVERALNNEVQGGREWHHIRFVRLGTIATVTR